MEKYKTYSIMMSVYLLFIIVAFIVDTPADIAQGLIAIITSRSILLSDYMYIGGVGAMLINAAIAGIFYIVVYIRVGLKPTGTTWLAMWLGTGFAMFGKSIFNMIPLTFGVWLYSKYKKEPFANFVLAALLSATISPVVSGIAFHHMLEPVVGIPIGISVGIFAGFIFPAIAAGTLKMHNGYNLFNMGVAGGLIATFLAAGMGAFGLAPEVVRQWGYGNDLPLSIMLYTIAAGFMLYGLFSTGKLKLPPYREMMKISGRTGTGDFIVLFGDAAYFNMGLFCAMATTLVLLWGVPINGPTIGGILTIVSVAAYGAHLRNTLPILIGALLANYLNRWDPTYPSNVLAILFSVGLVPMAGEFGIKWGIITGFVHVNLIMQIGFVNSGFNLYNNGYAAGFVVLFMIPVIVALDRKDKKVSDYFG
ncbi:MAG: DUF1576 domain-containing protein [Defluviitaleaceae bacterium]|nr:DUF1576 domain-containing protein [Defluviitaleaceae bacterium]